MNAVLKVKHWYYGNNLSVNLQLKTVHQNPSKPLVENSLHVSKLIATLWRQKNAMVNPFRSLDQKNYDALRS